jgi:hypothetical protein
MLVEGQLHLVYLNNKKLPIKGFLTTLITRPSLKLEKKYMHRSEILRILENV